MIGNDVEITGVRPVHPQDRMKRKLRTKRNKIIIDISEVLKKMWPAIDLSELKNKPYINFDIDLNTTDKEKRENAIMDLIQQNLPPDNDRFYTKYYQKQIQI